MSIIPITASTPACYGICCPQHGQCARYDALEGSDPVLATIATCMDGAGERPLFVQLQTEEASHG